MTLQGGVMQLAERIGGTKAIEAVMLSELLPAEPTGGMEHGESRRRGPCVRRDLRETADCQPGPDERRDQGATVAVAEQGLPARQGRTLRHFNAAVRRARRAGTAGGGRRRDEGIFEVVHCLRSPNFVDRDPRRPGLRSRRWHLVDVRHRRCLPSRARVKSADAVNGDDFA
jgi:hypothetical protein